MMHIITYKNEISCAHQLEDTEQLYTKKCAQLHGHNYTISVAVQGPLNNASMVIDYGYLKELLDKYDHKNINDLLEDSTAEVFASTLWQKVIEMFLNQDLHYVLVKVKETNKTAAYYGSSSLVKYLE